MLRGDLIGDRALAKEYFRTMALNSHLLKALIVLQVKCDANRLLNLFVEWTKQINLV